MVRWQKKIDAASMPAEVVVEAKGTHLGNLMVLAGYEDRTVLSNILNNVMPKLRSPSPASFLVRGARLFAGAWCCLRDEDAMDCSPGN